jgi:hypothetical protein
MSDNIDIFDSLANTDMSEVSTDMPVLAEGLYEFTVKGVSRQMWKSGKGSSLVIELSLASEGAVDTTGENAISVGYPVTDRISLVKSGNYDPIQNVARFLESIGMKDEPFDPSGEAYVGQTLQAKTKIESDASGEYPDKTAIRTYIKA